MLYIEVRNGELILLTEHREAATNLVGRESAEFTEIVDSLVSANIELAKCFWRMMEFLKGKPNGIWWVSFDGPCRVSHREKDYTPSKERYHVWVDCIDVTPEVKHDEPRILPSL